MKKIFALLLALLLLLAAGCSDEELPGGFLGQGGGTEPATQPSTLSTTPTTASATPTTTPATEPGATVPVTEAPTAVPTEAPTAAPTSAPTEAPTEAPTAAPQRPDPWSLMGESLMEQGSYTDAGGNTISYSYALPCLTADTPDARAINAKIDEDIGSMIRESLGNIAQGYDVGLISVGYYGEVWEDVLSLVIVLQWDFGGYTDYAVFCYDTVAERWLDTPALLEKMGIPQDYFLNSCKEAFRQKFKDLFAGVPEDQRADYGYYEFLERADGPEYVNLNLQIYPNAEGQVVVVAPIVSLAGADHYFHLLPLSFNRVN